MISFKPVRRAALLLSWILAAQLGCSHSEHITHAQAAAHVAQSVAVEGVVASVHTSRKGHTYLNFGAPYPNQDFTAMVYASNGSSFNDLDALEGKKVQVTGVVRLYEGKPEVVLDAPAQLKVLE
jgi:DNA/RNA endonuclease YhcR with UshA esterase domain